MMREIGSVAKQTFEASDWPARPPTMKIIGICAPRIACAATRTATFLLARVSLMALLLDLRASGGKSWRSDPCRDRSAA